EPVRPSSSRTKWISSSRGSMTLAYSVPLTLTVICTSGHPASSGYGAAQRADSQFAGEVALVLGRAALVGDGAAMLGRDLTGPGVAFLRRGHAAQELLGGLGREVLGADGRQADPRLPDPCPVKPDSGACRSDRPVTDPATDLLVRAAAAWFDRDRDLGEHLAMSHD